MLIKSNQWILRANKANTTTEQKVSVFGVFLVRIQSECGKKRARKTLNADTFCAVYQIRIQDLIIYQNGASSKIFERI